ncbi:hypothetical protein C8J57DRAFT_1634681 [Mycena rebaudengoi]|nr:hypothetical protein C8J57DRAFT_1634681 [Mycena rebaudengoi]
MLGALWNRVFPRKDSNVNPPPGPPLQRPLKYRNPDAGHAYLQNDKHASGGIQPQYYPQQYPQPLPQFQMQAQPYPVMQFPAPLPGRQGVWPSHDPHQAGPYFSSMPSIQHHWQPNYSQYQNLHSHLGPAPQPPPFLPQIPPPPALPDHSNPVISLHQPAQTPFPGTVVKTENSQIRVAQTHDHSASHDLDWPTGNIRRECLSGTEERKWKKNKWVWRSTGTVQHDGHPAEVRACLGVFRCGTCGQLTRPKTQATTRRNQQSEGCKSRTCLIEAPLLHDQCDARAFHYSIIRAGVSMSIWEHSGDHSSHSRPPGGTLSKIEEQNIDLQVLRKHEANAHQLRTGDIGPGSIPLADISPLLANPRAARYQLAQSQARLGMLSGPAKGGLALMASFADLAKRLSTPFIIDSCLSGPVYITLQTPFMDSIIAEAVESWIKDASEGPDAGRHGFVIDGDLSFFRQGPLLASCAFSITSNEWIPILYSWIHGHDTAHHRPHFAHIFKAVIKHAGSRSQRHMLLCVMDFSGAQRGAHAEEYADAIISTMPLFAALSPEAQQAERRQLVLEAQKAVVGCDIHFWRSSTRIKKSQVLVPPTSTDTFEKHLREMLSPDTISDRFDDVVQMLKSTFPLVHNWVNWWLRPSIAPMIFPAKRTLDPELSLSPSSRCGKGSGLTSRS